jgi:hypothetical protein
VKYSYNKNQQVALFLNFILVKNSTCLGQTYCASSGVLILYSQQLVFVLLVMLTFYISFCYGSNIVIVCFLTLGVLMYTVIIVLKNSVIRSLFLQSDCRTANNNNNNNNNDDDDNNNNNNKNNCKGVNYTNLYFSELALRRRQ